MHLNPFLSASAILSHVPYILGLITTARKQLKRSGALSGAPAFGKARALKRLESGANRKDLFYYLVRHHAGSGMLTAHWNQSQSGEDLPEAERPSFEDVAQNGILAIIAGSDTTSSVLTAVIFYLLLNPVAYEHLQEEVDSAFPGGDEPLDALKLSHLEWLNGCM